jgi:hypothetical protein
MVLVGLYLGWLPCRNRAGKRLARFIDEQNSDNLHVFWLSHTSNYSSHQINYLNFDFEPPVLLNNYGPQDGQYVSNIVSIETEFSEGVTFNY